TAAAALDGEVGLKITSDRFLEAMDTQEAISRRWYESWVGKQVEVLVEGPNKKNPEKSTGRTRENLMVHFMADKNYTGKFIHVNIMGAGRYSLEGRLS
ncbi:MAG: TRAM domain-containing protein, partial [Nitrospinota bacterium]|nr:TRAM domain-containing protein [Nitrospinota bacterium]